MLVPFMIPEHGFSTTPEQKSLSLSVVTLVGVVLRVPHTLAVPVFGGRTWTVIATLALVLASLRNPDRVPLIVSEPILSEPDRRHVDLLFEKRFTIVPDDSHRAINNTGAATGDARDFEGIERRFEEREPVSVLFGDRSDPRLRFDGSYMEAEAGDEELAGALRAMRENIERNRIECALGVGDLVLLDNHRVVHARSSFTARYDGTDRWLKRVNVRSARRSGVPG